MKLFKISAAVVGLIFSFAQVTFGQIAISSFGVAATENFTIGTSATASLPSNWQFSAPGTANPTWGAGGNFTGTLQQASSGSLATGSRYNWGDGTTTTDRAIGFMSSGSYASPSSIMSFYSNTTGSTIDSLAITFDIERYRINTAAASVTFFTSTNGSTWTAQTAGNSGAFTTGTNAYNFTSGTVISRSVTLTGLGLTNGSSFYLRWNFDTSGSNSQGLGLDNVSLTASAIPEPSTYAAIFGTLALVGTVWHRRRQRKAV